MAQPGPEGQYIVQRLAQCSRGLRHQRLSQWASRGRSRRATVASYSGVYRTKKGKCKEFVKARCMVKKDNPAFVAQFGAKRWLPAGKIGQLAEMYLLIMSGSVSLRKIDTKDRTWILLAALKYNVPVTLQPITPHASPVNGPAAEPLLPSLRSLVINTLWALAETKRCFLDNTTLIRKLKKCLHCVDIIQTVAPLTREKVTAAKHQLPRHLQQHINTMTKYVCQHFVRGACRDNIHTFAQILAILQQLSKNMEASSIADSILSRRLNTYHQPLNSSLDNASLDGIRLYLDNQ